MTVPPGAGAVVAALVAVGGASLALAAAWAGGVPPDEAAVAVAVAAYATVGLVVALGRPGHPVGRLMLGGAAVWGAGEAALAGAVQGLVTAPGSVPAAGWLALAGTLLRAGGWLLLVLGLPLLFPDGRWPSSPWRWTVPVASGALACLVATTLLSPTLLDDRLTGAPNPLGPPPSLTWLGDALALTTLGMAAVALAGGLGSLVARWRAGSRLVRQQLLWLTLAAAVPVGTLPVIAAGLATPVLFAVSLLPLPVAVGIAVLQHRLYDVHLAASRTLASLTLSAVLALVYVGVVGGVGALLEARGARWLPWVATGVVALSFAPLRATLQRAANRLAYGRWAQPEEVLAGVRRRLSDARDPGGLLRELVRELGAGLELPYLAVRDRRGDELAACGSPDGPVRDIPLTAYGAPVGTLCVADPRRPLRESDRRLLDDLADQLGALVHAAQLVARLRSARERLVLAREDERRRLRRDLHDGLGSALAGLTFKVEAARNLLRSDADAADATLRDLRGGIQAAVGDVRRVVQGLRPPSLDELGLGGALRELADRMARESGTDVRVDVAPSLPPLSAAVEVAAYRVGQEALTNVLRHAGAAGCRLTVRAEAGALVLLVEDSGRGLAPGRHDGTGVQGMRERAEELGGALVVDSPSGGGTSVRLRLPAVAPVAVR